MNKLLISAFTVVLCSGCATAPLDLQQSRLNEARTLIKQAHRADAEQCAPKLQAEAVAQLAHAAHELTERSEAHWQYNRDPLQRAIHAAHAALRRCAGTTHKKATPSRSPLLATIYFPYNQAIITKQEKQTLTKLLGSLRRTTRLFLEGHADERGSRRYNKTLSLRRAQNVADFLIRNGLPRNNIAEVTGFGETRPAVAGHDERAWSRNRRVEIRRAATPASTPPGKAR